MSSSIAGTGAISSVFGPVTGASPAPGGAGFGSALTQALHQVSSLQSDASQQVSTMMNGGSGDLGHVMISVEKADVAFQLMMQVRNKIVSAYQDIEKMQF